MKMMPWLKHSTQVLQEALDKYPKPKIFNSDQGSSPSEATKPMNVYLESVKMVA
jgi:hypothetical protein